MIQSMMLFESLALQCRSCGRSCGEIVSAVADRLPAVADRLPAVAEEAGRVSLRCIVREGIVLQLGGSMQSGEMSGMCEKHASCLSFFHASCQHFFSCLVFSMCVMCVMPCPGVCHFSYCGSKSGKQCVAKHCVSDSRSGPRSGGFLTAVADF